MAHSMRERRLLQPVSPAIHPALSLKLANILGYCAVLEMRRGKPVRSGPRSLLGSKTNGRQTTYPIRVRNRPIRAGQAPYFGLHTDDLRVSHHYFEMGTRGIRQFQTL